MEPRWPPVSLSLSLTLLVSDSEFRRYDAEYARLATIDRIKGHMSEGGSNLPSM